LAFFYCSPFGSASHNWRTLYLDANEWKDVKTRIRNKFQKTRPKMEVFIEPRFGNLNEEKKSAQGSLFDKHICSIDPVGEVYFCSAIIDGYSKRWSLGSLRDTPFKEIWDESNRWDHIRENFRKTVLRNCEGCHKLQTCQGGCTAVKLANSVPRLETRCRGSDYPICFMHWEKVEN
jgi:radical SAM protein with 4Fe4S-binding SPASM domain